MLYGYGRTAALKAAIGLELFTAIGEGAHSAAEIARRTGAAERGIRTLCDFLVVNEFLTKTGDSYELTADARVFLDKRSPAYLGSVTDFVCSQHLVEAWSELGASIRSGGRADSTVVSKPDHEQWQTFARAMVPMTVMPAGMIAERLGVAGAGPIRVLDIAAGHGEYGLAIARANPQARIVGQDWPAVLSVALERAKASGVAERYETIPGSALEVDFGGPYDIVLVPNFLHHFDPPTCERILRKVASALKPGGRIAIVEFVPNDDRVSLPWSAMFSMIMLATTESGDAYTLAEYDRMLENAGLKRDEAIPLTPAPSTLIVARKR